MKHPLYLLLCIPFLVAVGLKLYGHFSRPKEPLHYYPGQNILLSYNKAENVIKAELTQFYDVPPNIMEEQILNLLESLEKQGNEPYISWISTGKIVKRRPTYTVSVNGVEKYAEYDTPFISCDTHNGMTLVGGHPVIKDPNGVVLDWAD